MSGSGTCAVTLMSSNMTVIPGMNPVPTILTIEPPAAEPKAGMTAVTVGLAAVPPGDGASRRFGRRRTPGYRAREAHDEGHRTQRCEMSEDPASLMGRERVTSGPNRLENPRG